jgi:hypothetical protein
MLCPWRCRRAPNCNFLSTARKGVPTTWNGDPSLNFPTRPAVGVSRGRPGFAHAVLSAGPGQEVAPRAPKARYRGRHGARRISLDLVANRLGAQALVEELAALVYRPKHRPLSDPPAFSLAACHPATDVKARPGLRPETRQGERQYSVSNPSNFATLIPASAASTRQAESPSAWSLRCVNSRACWATTASRIGDGRG